jgi:PmbA protein
MNKNEKLELINWAMKEALKSGADETAVYYSNSREVEVSYRDKKLESLKESSKNSLSFDIYTGKKYSSHSTNDIRKESLSKFIAEAVASTKYLSTDEFRGLPDPKYYPIAIKDELELYDPLQEKVKTDERVRIAKELEESASKVSDKIISVTSSYSDASYSSLQMHSNGFTGEKESTVFSFGANVTVQDVNGGRPSDGEYRVARFFNELPNPAEIGKLSAERAIKKIGQKKIQSGKYDMIVENKTAFRPLAVLSGAMSGSALQQKRSFLEGALNTQVASEKLTIVDDPFIAKGLGSRYYDGEGLAAVKRTVFENGILRTFYIDNYYGKKLGMEPTSGGFSNLIFKTGDKTLEQMIKNMKKGIFVTGFIGGNSNSLTGDFSFGIVGYLVENGEIVQPVNEMNISGNGKDFFKKIVEVGSDPYPYSSIRVPSMAYEGVEFSGL